MNLRRSRDFREWKLDGNLTIISIESRFYIPFVRVARKFLGEFIYGAEKDSMSNFLENVSVKM